MLTLVAFLTAIAILVVWHELGHYLAARACGVKVLRFSVGFGRPIFSKRSEKTGTEWSISAIPLGGYVAMLDEREAEAPIAPDQIKHAFNRQPLLNRAFIVVAGPFANFLLALLLYWGLAVMGTQEPAPIVERAPANSFFANAGFNERMRILSIDDEPVQSMNDASWRMTAAALSRTRVSVRVTGAQGEQTDVGSVLNVDFGALTKNELEGHFLSLLGWRLAMPPPKIGELIPDGAAQRDGLQVGDLIVSVEQISSPSVIQVIELVQASANRPLVFTVLRGNSKLQLQVTPVKSTSDKNAKIGVGFVPLERVEVRYGLFEGVEVALRKTWDITALTLKMLGQIVLGQASLSNLSGPLTIADAAGKTAGAGLGPYITFLALVSVGLGVLNLLPVPMLDGGHLLYYAAESVTGRPLSEGVMVWGQRIGIGLLSALMIIALTNDLVRLLG